MKYTIILLLLVAACDIPTIEVPVTDTKNSDVREDREDLLNIWSPQEKDVLQLNGEEVSVSTDFPAPSWFR